MSDITLKIHDGTGRQTGEALCMSCAHAAVIQNNEVIICQAVHPNVRMHKKVFKCREYYNKDLPSVRRMEEIAWELKFDGRKVGFSPPVKKKESWDE